MARVTVEDCLEKVDNRFLLVMLASKRVKQLYKGNHPLIDPKNNRDGVMDVAIRAGKIAAVEPAKTPARPQVRSIPITPAQPPDQPEPPKKSKGFFGRLRDIFR